VYGQSSGQRVDPQPVATVVGVGEGSMLVLSSGGEACGLCLLVKARLGNLDDT
jgi:hypothetical protein